MHNPGSLYQHRKFDFKVKYCGVNSDNKILLEAWSNRKLPSEVLMFIEPLDYSEETTTSLWPSTTAALVASTTMVTAAAAEQTSWNVARKEFKKTGKIPGGIFLTGSGKLIWISHYDVKNALKEIKKPFPTSRITKPYMNFALKSLKE